MMTAAIRFWISKNCWNRISGNPDEKLVQLKSLETLKEVANGEANKVFIPFEATSTLSSLGAIKEVLKEEKKK